MQPSDQSLHVVLAALDTLGDAAETSDHEQDGV